MTILTSACWRWLPTGPTILNLVMRDTWRQLECVDIRWLPTFAHTYSRLFFYFENIFYYLLNEEWATLDNFYNIVQLQPRTYTPSKLLSLYFPTLYNLPRAETQRPNIKKRDSSDKWKCPSESKNQHKSEVVQGFWSKKKEKEKKNVNRYEIQYLQPNVEQKKLRELRKEAMNHCTRYKKKLELCRVVSVERNT